MEHNLLSYFGKILLQIVWDFIYFPLWWYSAGLVKTIRGVGQFYHNEQVSLNFFVWLKNIFVPMYGQHDLTGRLISFFMRLVQVIFRGLLMLIVLILGLAFLIFYIILPPAILLAIWKQLL